jgi:hypothetical protein
MSDIFYRYYLNLKNDFKNIMITKIKKNKIFIKDGIFIINYDLNDLMKCSFCGNFNECDYRKCKHIYFILTSHYKLDFYDLFFLWKNNNYKKLLKTEKFDYTNEECGFCLDTIIYDKYKLYNQCLNCGNCYHNKCLRQFQKNDCINCKSKII